jgi:hypothetical protein
MSLYRLYFDESGDHTYHALETANRRYLALCGLIFEDERYRVFQEEFVQLKRNFFKGDPDEPIIMHRADILNRRGVFSVLQEQKTMDAFDEALLALINTTPYVGVIVVIDKKSHSARYSSPLHPYHYCLAALLERYCFWLGGRRGDVMGESRGGVEDRQLKAAYQAIYRAGTLHVNADVFQARLSSKDIKLKPKEKNVAGLQFADLIAHPAKQRCLVRHNIAGIKEGTFGAQVADSFWTKLRKRWNGETKGFGEVFLA